MQMQEPNPSLLPSGSMSLISHLDELRRRLLRYLVVFVICLLATYGLRKDILDLIRAPVEVPLQKYSQAAQAKQKQTSGGIADLDDYTCNCTRNPSAVVTSPLATMPAPTQSVRPDFPLAAPPKVDLNDKVSHIQDASASEWLSFAKSTYHDFLALYYSLQGNDQKAAETLGQTAQQNKSEVYQPTQSELLELNCRCVRDNSENKDGAMVYLGLPELFFAQMKVAIYSAVFISFPYLLFELWGFVGPALYRDEKFVYWGFGISSFLFFIGGASFGYFVVFPFGFDFFLSLTQPGEIMPSLSIGGYLDFTLKLFLAFGLIFELPVAVFILARLGIITPKLMISQARPAMVVILILSAVGAPTNRLYLRRR